MKDFVLKELVSKDMESELKKVGFDSSYLESAAKKYQFKTIKIFDVTPAQANILKQTALANGCDCATHKNVITGKIEKSSVILGGSISELTKIVEKIKYQPFSLSILADKILNTISISPERRTKITGILNITPDSSSDGGQFFNPQNAIRHLEKLIADGADMIDIGAESTKPYAKPVDATEQIERLKPVLKEIKNFNTPISIDTRSSEVAKYAIDSGIHLINDVSGFDYDKNMADVIAKSGAGIIIQHSLGTPQTMQNNPQYNDVVEEIYMSLLQKIEFAVTKGIKNIIIDPGIGFGKNKEHNFEIINRIEEFYSLNCPIMVGISRKSFLGKYTDNDTKDSLSLAVSYPLIQKVDYLRVHNVKLHKQLVNMAIS